MILGDRVRSLANLYSTGQVVEQRFASDREGVKSDKNLRPYPAPLHTRKCAFFKCCRHWDPHLSRNSCGPELLAEVCASSTPCNEGIIFSWNHRTK